MSYQEVYKNALRAVAFPRTMLSTLLSSVSAWRAATPARSLIRRGACTMVATTRTTFSAADFPAEWPYTDEDFSRLDEQADIQFYSAPRFVTHIDDGAIATLKQYYDEQLPEGADVLDICSSWISHLPPDKPLGRVVGVGMNARELDANERLTEFVQADLNRQPVIEFPDASFDACLCVVSVDYLTQPRKVLSEVHRVLRPGGRAIFSFSNRCFPSKAVKKWLQADDAARQKIVASYFVFSPTGGWENIGGEQLPQVQVQPPSPMEGFMGKFQAAVGKWAVNGDPMFVVTATKL